MLPSERSTLKFFVNGKKVTDNNVDPAWSLLYYLRNKLRLCGTKLGCGEGGCGACTVMISKYDRKSNKLIHVPIVSCLTPLCSIHGLAITTVEGIGNTKVRLHPVQERIAKAHGSQCGFCTPGIVMSMYTLLRNMPKPSMKDIMLYMQGNLCRCTGYRPIIEGFKTFTKEYQENCNNTNNDVNVPNVCSMGKDCCKLKSCGITSKDDEINLSDMDNVLFHAHEFAPYDPSQEPIFPPELKLNDVLDKEALYFSSEHVKWYRPLTLEQVLDLKTQYPDAKLVNGNTEIGVEVKAKVVHYPVYIAGNLVPELSELKVTNEGLLIGSSVTLTEIENILETLVAKEASYKTRVFSSMLYMLELFASRQVRSAATLSGNVMTGSPISDMIPILMAAEAELLIKKKTGERKIKFTRQFFTGYRRNIVDKEEILVSILIPFSKENQHFHAYKQSRRIDDDIAIVNGAFSVFLTKEKVIEKISFAFGGMAPTTVDAPKTSQALIGLPWDMETLEKACNSLLEEIPLPPGAPGGMTDYRKSLTVSLFFKAFLTISKDLACKLDKTYLSGVNQVTINTPKSSQFFSIGKERMCYDTVGCPTVHISALKQASGEAIYIDDIPHYKNELYMAFVTSTKAHANLLKIDPTEALAEKGVHGFLYHENCKQFNKKWGPITQDEELFATKTVNAEGQTIGVILADDIHIAHKAAQLVKVEYEELKPILTLEEAIKANSYHDLSPYKVESGDVDKVFKEAKNVIQGECRMGGQEHFYLETQAVLVNPKLEDDEYEVFSSTQHPSEINHLVASVLGIPENRVVTKVKRLGGGFGGKESRACLLALPAAVAASKFKRPIRCMLHRDHDMVMTAGRHPFLFKYKVAFDDCGNMLAVEMYLYCNAGHSKDLSDAVMQRALLHMCNAYTVPNVRAIGYVCKTNMPSNTAFRGFGGPQGMFAAENMIRDIADYLKADIVDVTRRNLCKENDMTYFKVILNHCTLDRCFDECLKNSNYSYRKGLVEHFNNNNRWKKRGLSVIPTMFGIAFNVPFNNQSGALVIIYTDGSVLLSHGGVEMGQGLHTKMIQIASKVLEIPTSKIYIVETATDKVPNTPPTAASVGSDLNGPAVLQACETLKKRLQPFKDKNPNGKWEDWVKQAYLNRVSLSATGYFKLPGVDGYNFATGDGTPFSYFVYGVACSEVEIDCLTGAHSVLRTDIVMDLGESLNPAIDIGQIEGGFMQGYGLMVLEELVYSSKGTMISKGPGAYKIPGFGDIPHEFNVSLLRGAPNPRAVYSSKAVGEPPLFLASSVFFAIKEAITAARKAEGIEEPFVLNSPATCERIRMACPDFITKKIKPSTPGSYTPWNIIP